MPSDDRGYTEPINSHMQRAVSPCVAQSQNNSVSNHPCNAPYMPLQARPLAPYPPNAPRAHPCVPQVKTEIFQSENSQQSSYEHDLKSLEDSKLKAARKRERTPNSQGEGYRERWTKKQPRRQGKTWMSDICSVCEQSSDKMLTCMGPCLRAFHPWCIGMPDEEVAKTDASKWFCPQCESGIMSCFVCGEFGAGHNDPFVRKCSLGSCGRFYHLKCVESLKFTRSAAKGQHFYCPQHYCVACGKSGDGVDMVKCIRCPNAYHSSCTSKNGAVKKLKQGTKVILCAAHQGELPRNYMHPPPPNPERLKRAIDEARAQGIPVGKDRRSKGVEAVPAAAVHSSMVLPPRYGVQQLSERAHCPYPPKSYVSAHASHVDPFGPRSGALATHHLDDKARNVRPRLMPSAGSSMPVSSTSVSSSTWPDKVPTMRRTLSEARGPDNMSSIHPLGAEHRQLRRSSTASYLPASSAKPHLGLCSSHGALRTAHSAPINFMSMESSPACRNINMDDPMSLLETPPRQHNLHRLASHVHSMAPEHPHASQHLVPQSRPSDRYHVMDNMPHSQSHAQYSRRHEHMPYSTALPMEDKHTTNNDYFRVVSARDGNSGMSHGSGMAHGSEGKMRSIGSYGNYIPSSLDYMDPIKTTDLECSSAVKREPKDVSSVTINVGTDACLFDASGQHVAVSRPMVMRSVSNSHDSFYGCYDMFAPTSTPQSRPQTLRGGAPDGATGALPPHTSSLSIKSYPMIERSESPLNGSNTTHPSHHSHASHNSYPSHTSHHSHASNTSSLLHQSWEHLSTAAQSNSITGSPVMQQASTGASHLTGAFHSPSDNLPDPTELSQSFVSPQPLGPPDLAGFEEFVESFAMAHGGPDCHQGLPLDTAYMGLDHDVFSGLGDDKSVGAMPLGADILDLYPL